MSFDRFQFDPRIAAGKGAGYHTPTPIQAEAIPVVLQGRDLLGVAQTGTGKTAAFVLPILQRLTSQRPSDGGRRRVRALVLSPTRELAEQTQQATRDLGKHTSVRSVSIYGGVSKAPDIAALRRGVDVVVACPGRLLDHMRHGDINLSDIEVLVLDEADRMCDMGFLPDIRRILDELPTERQTLFFSATMPDDIRALAGRMLRDPITVQIGDIAPVETVTHALYPTTDRLKTRLLLALLQDTATGRVLVFTRTKRRARSLALELARHDYRVAALQGNMAQNRRQQAIDGFRRGRYDILVATGIAARGIDVPEISHVINYDMPDTVDAYTHRIGRTGRAQLTGEAYTLVTYKDEPIVHDIERALGARVERRTVPGFDYGGFSPDTAPRQAPTVRRRSFAPRGHRGPVARARSSRRGWPASDWAPVDTGMDAITLGA